MKNEMYDKIRQTLSEMEQKREIKILYAAEAGSRGWGFPARDSDYHCKFIYVHPQKYYLAIHEEKDSIELSVDAVYDVNGWDLKRALKSIWASDPAILEWLQSPMIYMEKDSFKEKLLTLFTQYFDELAALECYRSKAAIKFEDIKKHPEERLRRYFYVLRVLLAADYIINTHQIPPMTFKSLYDNASISQQVRQEIETLLKLKSKSDDWIKIPHNPLLIDYFEKLLSNCEDYLQKQKGYTAQKPNENDLNQFFREWVNL